MNNMELTRSYHQLAGQVNDLASRLAQAIPKIEQDVANSENDIKTMFESLKAEFKPNVDNVPLLIDTSKNLQEQITGEATRLAKAETLVVEMQAGRTEYEQKVNQSLTELKRIHDTVQASAQQSGTEAQARVNVEVKVDLFGAKLEELVHEHEHLKKVEENHYQQQQMQMATVQSMSSSPSTGGMSSSSRSEPLAINKLVASEDKIEGTEDKQTLEDWFEGVSMKINLIYPGAKAILDWASSNSTEITASEIARRPDMTLATMLSLQLYVFLRVRLN